MKKAYRFGVVVLLLGLSAFAVRSGEPDTKLPIWKADEEFSRVTGERGLQGFLSCVAEDFQTVRPNSPLIGKQEFGEGSRVRVDCRDGEFIFERLEPAESEAPKRG